MARKKANNKNDKKQESTKYVARSLVDEMEIKRLKKELTECKRDSETKIKALEAQIVKLNLQKNMPCMNSIVCSKKNFDYLIYCEGNKDSLDYIVYSIVFPDALIWPTGGSVEVERMINDPILCLESYGIIDRDDRDKEKIYELEERGIYTIKVRSIENLFFTDGFLRMLLKRLAIQNPDTVIFRLKTAAMEFIWKNEQKKVRHKDALKEFPNKKVVHFVGQQLGFAGGRDVMGTIQKILNEENEDTLKEVFWPYMPEKIRNV